MSVTIEDIPDGLHSLQYAANVCEETLGFPSLKANLELIAACIEAVGKKLFRGRPDELKVATYWLRRRLETAQSNGEKITTHWLRNGEYWGVDKPTPYKGRTVYEHHGQGYNEEDMKYLWRIFKRKRDLVKRTLTSEEIDGLMDELDSKRGRKPAWRS